MLYLPQCLVDVNFIPTFVYHNIWQYPTDTVNELLQYITSHLKNDVNFATDLTPMKQDI